MTDRLGWHVPDNLRWLAEQSDRPDYVPIGMLTGSFLLQVADRYDKMAKEPRSTHAALRSAQHALDLIARSMSTSRSLKNLALAESLSIASILAEHPSSHINSIMGEGK